MYKNKTINQLLEGKKIIGIEKRKNNIINILLNDQTHVQVILKNITG